MNDERSAQHPTPDHAPDDAIAAWALGILDPGEAMALEAHLAGCLTCRATLARHEEVVGALGATAAPVPPRPQLRATLLAEIGEPAPRPAAPRPLRPRAITIALGVAAALALIAAAVLGILLANTLDERDDARYGEYEIADYLADGGTLSALVPAPDAPADAAIGHGSLAVVPDGHKAMLVLTDLPPTGDDRRYLAWAERDGERIELGELPVNDDGIGWLVFWPPELMSAYETVVVTRVSPDAPDGEPFLIAPVE